MTTQPTYEYWRNALAGKEQQTHVSDPHEGFWYKRQRDGAPRLPVATWWQDGALVAKVGFEGAAEMADPIDIWTWICATPVSEEFYRAAYESGQWPDDPPPAPGSVIGHNLPDDPFERIKSELQGEEENAKDFLAAPIATQADADKCAVWAKRVGELQTRADETRKVEKQPHLDASRAVDDKWRGTIEGATSLKQRLKAHVEKFLIAKERAEAERRRELAAEAERLREAAANAFESGERDAEDQGRRLEQQAQLAETVATLEPMQQRAGRSGARVGLRTEKKAKIVDYAAAHMALRDHPEMKALVEQLANRAVRAGLPLAGVEVETVKKAV